ncbi:MAG: hypothetical protein RLZZ522_666 [Verrucomicrobiota bacterium]|jgi:hypothetical protein
MEMKLPQFVPQTWALPDAIRRRLGDEAGRQRLMDEEGHLLLILHVPPQPADDEVRHPLVLWRSPLGEWKSAPAGGGLAALTALLAAYRTLIGELDENVDTARTPRDYFDVMKGVNPLQRSCRSLLAVMEEARKARPDERALILLRDQAVNLERAVELVANDARSGMEFSVAESSDSQAREAQQTTIEARRLNRLVAFFFPVATMAAVFGMNQPEDILTMPGVWAVIASGAMLGWLVRAVIGRKN